MTSTGGKELTVELAEEDEFLEFEVQDWTNKDTAKINDESLWEVSWDDADGGDDTDFSTKLRAELKKSMEQ
jgi:hypothetical protein